MTTKERLGGATRAQHAIRVEREQEKAAHPVRSFWAGAVRKAAGVALIWWGKGLLDRTFSLPEATGTVALVAAYLMAALVLAFGAFALAPDLTMTVLRFFGLGGVVDKVLKRGNGTPP